MSARLGLSLSPKSYFILSTECYRFLIVFLLQPRLFIKNNFILLTSVANYGYQSSALFNVIYNNIDIADMLIFSALYFENC